MSEHIEVKPKQPPTWEQIANTALEQGHKLAAMCAERSAMIAQWKEMYYAMKAERDAARAELARLKEEGK